jgi:hypothetical protein
MSSIPQHPLSRIATALALIGIGLWPRTRAPMAIDVGQGRDILRVSPIGFQPEDNPNPIWMWVTLDQLLACIARFDELNPDRDGEEYADETQAKAFWRVLAAEAKDDVHLYQCSTCACWGCRYERKRWTERREVLPC